MPLEIVQPRRLYRQVAEQLRGLIEKGEYKPGARLPTERELAGLLGVSRPVVREALIALEVEGYVRIRVGSGIYAEPPDVRRMSADAGLKSEIPGPFDILSARALIEGEIAAAAAGVARAADIRRLDAALGGMRATVHPSMESLACDRAFHLAIAHIIGNETVVRVVGDLFDQRINPYFAQLASYFENEESWANTIAEHIAIREAIAGRDPAGAKQAMRQHLENSQARFTISFGEGPRQSRDGGRLRLAPDVRAIKRRK